MCKVEKGYSPDLLTTLNNFSTKCFLFAIFGMGGFGKRSYGERRFKQNIREHNRVSRLHCNRILWAPGDPANVWFYPIGWNRMMNHDLNQLTLDHLSRVVRRNSRVL